jgi:hypothetical protein
VHVPEPHERELALEAKVGVVPVLQHLPAGVCAVSALGELLARALPVLVERGIFLSVRRF